MRLFRKPAAVRIPDRTLHVTRAKGSTARPFFMAAGDELAYYGTALTGRPFGRILLRDAPETEDDNQWVQLEAKTRLKPDGAIFHAYRAEPKPEPAAKPVRRAGRTIEPAIDAALRAHWIWYCRPPASIRVNPADAADLVRAWADRQAREMAEIGTHWPEIAEKYRAEDQGTPAAAAISHWVDNYSGGVEIPFIMDATVPRGEVRLEPEHRPRFTFAGTTGRGCYAFTPDNEAARAILPHGADQWTTTPEYFWTGETAE